MQYGTLGDYDRELDEFKKEYCASHGMTQAQFSYDLIPWDIIKLYAAKDTDATLALYYKFYPVLFKNKRLLDCYNNLMLPALHFLTRMEDRGIPISRERLEFGKELLVNELEGLQKELYTFKEIKQLESDQGKVFNLFSYVSCYSTT
jgi:DNA polymerase I-like protein with 3'-5' exonuclease and polymerase domains